MEPIFSTRPPTRSDVLDPVPPEDNPAPQSFTARVREALLASQAPLFTAGQPDETPEEN